MKNISSSLAIIILLGTAACNDGPKESQNAKDSLSGGSNQASQNSQNAMHSILGVWRLENDDATSFEIKNDAINYFDQGKEYKYDLKGDSIIIHYDDWIYRGKIKRDNNMLIITDSLNQSKYIKGN